MKNKSFTLIELLVVIVIIGILAGVIIVSVSSSINKANFAKAQSFSNTVQNELLGDLVSEWTFNEDSGTTAVDTWGNSDGILKEIDYSLPCDTSHCPQFTQECVSGGCYYFESNDYILIPETSDLKIGISDFTISVWIKTNATKEHGRSIVSRYNPGFLLRNQYGGIEFGVNNGTYWDFMNYKVNTTVIDDYNWHHLAGIRDVVNNGIRLYLDGMEVFDTGGHVIVDISGDITSNSLDWYIGSMNASWDYIGYIDDVRFFMSALPSAQIKQQYIAGLDSLLSKNIISQEDYNQRVISLAQN